MKQETLFDRPAPGDTVSFYTDANGYRTGTLVREIRRGRDKGLLMVRSTCELRRGRRVVHVAPEMVEAV